jgi:hypothetical protein
MSPSIIDVFGQNSWFSEVCSDVGTGLEKTLVANQNPLAVIIII